MKKTIVLILINTIALTYCYSQDLIINKNGDEIKAKVQEVGTIEIKYKKFENINGPIYTISKNEVFMIRYENGSKDVFNEIKKENEVKINNNTSKSISPNLQEYNINGYWYNNNICFVIEKYGDNYKYNTYINPNSFPYFMTKKIDLNNNYIPNTYTTDNFEFLVQNDSLIFIISKYSNNVIETWKRISFQEVLVYSQKPTNKADSIVSYNPFRDNGGGGFIGFSYQDELSLITIATLGYTRINKSDFGFDYFFDFGIGVVYKRSNTFLFGLTLSL